jgi:hypothetical protein
MLWQRLLPTGYILPVWELHTVEDAGDIVKISVVLSDRFDRGFHLGDQRLGRAEPDQPAIRSRAFSARQMLEESAQYDLLGNLFAAPSAIQIETVPHAPRPPSSLLGTATTFRLVKSCSIV